MVITFAQGVTTVISAISCPVPANSQLSRKGLFLLAGLLFLRLPFLVPAGMLRLSPVYDIYYTGTYWLTLLLIWVERDRLSQYHIGPAATALLALNPVIDQAVYRIAKATTDTPLILPVRWLELVPGLILLIALAVRGFPRPVEGRRIWMWVLAALPLGLMAAALFGLAYRSQTAQVAGQVVPLAAIAMNFTIQFTRAAAYEEPLFRGFLWGALRQRQLSDLHVWLLQVGLFSIGHLYYFRRFPISFWLVVPVTGMVCGLLAWRSRSIIPGMVAHGIANGLAVYFESGAWL
jgi:hypothetical protein